MDLEAITYLVINRKSDNNFRLKIAKLGEYYCHDSILIIPKGGKDAYLLGTNNACLPGLGQQYKVGEFNPKTEGTFVSKKNTTTITFENWDHNNVMGKWAISSTAKVVNEFVNEHLLPKQER